MTTSGANKVDLISVREYTTTEAINEFLASRSPMFIYSVKTDYYYLPGDNSINRYFKLVVTTYKRGQKNGKSLYQRR